MGDTYPYPDGNLIGKIKSSPVFLIVIETPIACRGLGSLNNQVSLIKWRDRGQLALLSEAED